jgi:hypothetical protein
MAGKITELKRILAAWERLSREDRTSAVRYPAMRDEILAMKRARDNCIAQLNAWIEDKPYHEVSRFVE